MVLIFDMDGVIVDNHQFHFDAFVEFGNKHNITITREGFGPNFGKTNRQIMKALFGEHLSEAEINTLADEKEQIYREIYKPFIKPLKGLPEFLGKAKKLAIPIAMATSAPAENVRFTLNETGLGSYFDVITDSSMVKRGKPDPEVYQVTAAKLGVHPADCVVFEDSFSGIESAQKAGMRVIGVATTFSTQELASHVKDIIRDFEEVYNFLEIPLPSL